MIFEVNLVVKLDPDANFIAADTHGAESGLEDALIDALYELDDLKVLEIEVKEKL